MTRYQWLCSAPKTWAPSGKPIPIDTQGRIEKTLGGYELRIDLSPVVPIVNFLTTCNSFTMKLKVVSQYSLPHVSLQEVMPVHCIDAKSASEVSLKSKSC